MAPSQHDWKIVYRDVKQQSKKKKKKILLWNFNCRKFAFNQYKLVNDYMYIQKHDKYFTSNMLEELMMDK